MESTQMSLYRITDHDRVLDNPNKSYVLKVKDLADEDKPRERLLSQGPEALSVAELLAILLTVGTKKEEVLTMASRIIKEYGEKAIANQRDPRAIERELGVPIAKASQIVSCFELGRRFFKATNNGGVVIRTPKQAFEYLKDMRDLTKEHLRGLYLNSRYQLIRDEVISVGSLTANIVHPREVFKPALEYSAAAVIIAHNHPSGSIAPTESDIETTKQIVAAGIILGVEVLDHLIITKTKFASISLT